MSTSLVMGVGYLWGLDGVAAVDGNAWFNMV